MYIYTSSSTIFPSPKFNFILFASHAHTNGEYTSSIRGRWHLLLRSVPAGFKHLHTETVTNPSFLTSSKVISVSESLIVLATLIGRRLVKERENSLLHLFIRLIQKHKSSNHES
jgi:hypothetical protein